MSPGPPSSNHPSPGILIPTSPLHLVSASDTRFFPGLLTAIGTAIACASGRFAYCVTVLDGGITNDEWRTLDTTLKHLASERGIGLELHRLIPDPAVLKSLPCRRGSVLTYARLAIPRLIEAPYIVYMDSDVVCLRGVEEFWETLDADVALSAARDPLGCIGNDRTARQNLLFSARREPYFNAGIIGIHAARWRSPAIAGKLDQMVARAQDFKYVDQSLLNILFHGGWREVSPLNNFVLTLGNCGHLANLSEPANFHYVGSRKPWLTPRSSLYRYAPDRLFDIVFRNLSGKDSFPERHFSPAALVKAKRKAMLYRIFRPARACEYQRAIRSVETGEAIAAALWTRFGPQAIRSLFEALQPDVAELDPHRRPDVDLHA